MTSPPSRETGPTPEEQAREIIAAMDVAGGTAAFSREYVDTPAPHTVVLDAEIAALIPILTRLVSAAKRSAHLEDARAGCLQCRENGAPDPEYIAGKRCGWFHGPRGCARPEVWDALSRTGDK